MWGQARWCATYPSDLSSIPRNSWAEGENWPLQIVLWSSHVHCGVCTVACAHESAHTHIHTHSKLKTNQNALVPHKYNDPGIFSSILCAFISSFVKLWLEWVTCYAFNVGLLKYHCNFCWGVPEGSGVLKSPIASPLAHYFGETEANAGFLLWQTKFYFDLTLWRWICYMCTWAFIPSIKLPCSCLTGCWQGWCLWPLIMLLHFHCGECLASVYTRLYSMACVCRD